MSSRAHLPGFANNNKKIKTTVTRQQTKFANIYLQKLRNHDKLFFQTIFCLAFENHLLPTNLL